MQQQNKLSKDSAEDYLYLIRTKGKENKNKKIEIKIIWQIMRGGKTKEPAPHSNGR